MYAVDQSDAFCGAEESTEVVYYSSKFNEYGIPVHDGENGTASSYIDIQYCPWCGKKLPKSKRDEWFDTLEKRGYEDPYVEDIPPEFKTSEWYEKPQNSTKETRFPVRKHPRLKEIDYGMDGAYFITICTQNRRGILSNIVGRGLAPADMVELTEYGKTAREQLSDLSNRFPTVTVDRYVIMPNHIHILLQIRNAAGASPRPTVMDIVCAYKSLTTKACKAIRPINKVFQDSFYEHIVRNEKDYEEIAYYIENNPLRWWEDSLYTEET